MALCWIVLPNCGHGRMRSRSLTSMIGIRIWACGVFKTSCHIEAGIGGCK